MLRTATSTTHPVIPDAPQHHFDDAVLIRDRQHAGGVRGGKIPCLQCNMKYVAPRMGWRGVGDAT